MKLIIQIPCFNEEATLAQTVADLPKEILGIDEIQLQVINDGSTDRTLEVAQELNIDHIISFPHNRGLSAAFKAGVDNALKQRADILVNTDADNQYRGEDIAKLVPPILEGKYNIVIGCRPIDEHPDFSPLKKFLQKLGTWVVNKISGLDVRDATSGFRCYSRAELMHLNLFNSFSYTLETLIQAGHRGSHVCSVPVRVNPRTRDSRLYKDVAHYIWESTRVILRSFLVYRSRRVFGLLSLSSLLIGLFLASRYYFMVFVREVHVSDFWPSILAAAAFLIFSIIFYVTGTIASLITTNRQINEEVLFHLRSLNFESHQPDRVPDQER